MYGFSLAKTPSKNKRLSIFVWIVFMISRIEYCVKYAYTERGAILRERN